ncbi:hypothetical protein PISMIDRAFT_175301 [Pisolithus microcarpus 441]|uniref:Uncharacterized protein n=1 Tax=Pisolithus microcarpus 441 TaxID=765257 RepID=A0A0C9Y240_9AGAM|nr:hypothetical protein PISMIDRAFT_175301 [Pisolithus microcarpus 441]
MRPASGKGLLTCRPYNEAARTCLRVLSPSSFTYCKQNSCVDTYHRLIVSLSSS